MTFRLRFSDTKHRFVQCREMDKYNFSSIETFIMNGKSKVILFSSHIGQKDRLGMITFFNVLAASECPFSYSKVLHVHTITLSQSQSTSAIILSRKAVTDSFYVDFLKVISFLSHNKYSDLTLPSKLYWCTRSRSSYLHTYLLNYLLEKCTYGNQRPVSKHVLNCLI